MKTALRPLFLGLAVPLAAQNMISYNPGGAGASFVQEYPMLSPAFSVAAGGPGVIVGPMPAPARPLLAHPRGSIAADDTTGILYTTNGMVSIQRSWYQRLGIVPPAAVLPSLPIPAAVGQVTGMAVDPATKHVFVSNGVTIFELDPFAAMAIVCSWASGVPAAVTDLELDPAAPGLLYGLDATGQILTYNRCGGLVGVMPPAYAAPAAMAVGLALDRSMPAGGALPFFVLWANGNVYDQSLGAVHAGGFLNHAGLTFLASGVNLPSAAMCGGVKPLIRTSMPSVAGTAGFGFELGAFPAGTPFVALALDLGPFAGPVALGAGGTLWLPGALASFVVVPGAGATTAAMPLALPGGGAFLGLQVNGQWFVPCPAGAAGFVLTDAIQVEISR